MTNQNLASFNENAGGCVKCGYPFAGVEYVRAMSSSVERADIAGAPAHAEFLKRTCDRCGYAWAEACLDRACVQNPSPDNVVSLLDRS